MGSEDEIVQSRSRTCGWHRGFTMVELLVVITIIALLIMLLLPALQAAREATRNMQCRNNLKQITLACHSYHSIHNCFPMNLSQWSHCNPAGSNNCGGTAADNKPTFTNLVYILPYVEQQALYDRLDFGKNSRQSPNANYAGALISTYNCPSDPSSTQRITNGTKHANDYMSSVPATTPRSYFASGFVYRCNDSAHNPNQWTRSPNGYCSDTGGEGFQAWKGVYQGQSNPVRSDNDIHDGLSNTLAFGEMVPECFNSSNWMYGDTSSISAANGINLRVKDSLCCRSSGATWGADWQHCASFRSRHPDGMNAAMADGSVQFIRDTIDMKVFLSLGTIAGGEANAMQY